MTSNLFTILFTDDDRKNFLIYTLCEDLDGGCMSSGAGIGGP
jgi:hypothetical protein